MNIGKNVSIGAYCHISGNVELGDNTKLESHVVITGRTKIGSNNHIFPFASIGFSPQDLKYKGEPSGLLIGNNNVIREYVTINPGTEGGGMITKIGNNCLFMVSTHVAHDCQVGNHVVMANNATLAGHVTVEDHVIIGGLSAVHQFVRIGTHSIIGGMSGIENDVIPYASVVGERAYLAGLNLVGLKRCGASRETIHALRNAYREIFSNEKGTLAERTEKVANDYESESAVQEIIAFIRKETSRALCLPKDASSV